MQSTNIESRQEATTRDPEEETYASRSKTNPFKWLQQLTGSDNGGKSSPFILEG